MLGKLFGSKSRVEILKLFLFNPSERYYIRQIARELDLQLNSVRRELENLKDFGLLVVDKPVEVKVEKEERVEEGKKGERPVKKRRSQKKEGVSKVDKKYFRVDKNFALFKELKAMMVKSQTLYKQDFAERLKEIGKLQLLVLTGFFVGRDKMPVDLLVVGTVNKTKLIKIVGNMEKELGREINYTVMDLKEFKYRRDITDVFLYDILEGKRVVVVDEDLNV